MLYDIIHDLHYIVSNFLGIADFLFLCSLTWCVGMMFVLEPSVSLEAASLSLGLKARYVYISPSSDPISSFAICGIY
ncbi:hypothetical protein Hanom_Chr14g01290401 [Helianthus anomalus]